MPSQASRRRRWSKWWSYNLEISPCSFRCRLLGQVAHERQPKKTKGINQKSAGTTTAARIAISLSDQDVRDAAVAHRV
jgi:hypothetical protein